VQYEPYADLAWFSEIEYMTSMETGTRDAGELHAIKSFQEPSFDVDIGPEYTTRSPVLLLILEKVRSMTRWLCEHWELTMQSQ
jgi:hypothetical protein